MGVGGFSKVEVTLKHVGMLMFLCPPPRMCQQSHVFAILADQCAACSAHLVFANELWPTLVSDPLSLAVIAGKYYEKFHTAMFTFIVRNFPFLRSSCYTSHTAIFSPYFLPLLSYYSMRLHFSEGMS